MYCLFVIGTAGSGKSLLTSSLVSWYREKENDCISVNLDPGVVDLPYEPDVDIRRYINLQSVMDSYKLGPNGALILSCDLVASNLGQILPEIEAYNSDYVIFDTPGQMETFTYRPSGPFIVQNVKCDAAAALFLFDSGLVSSPANLISIALLATSVQLRLGIPQIPILSKCDIVGEKWKEILRWSSKSSVLEGAIRSEESSLSYMLSKEILRSLTKSGFAHELIPVSAVTRKGLLSLSGTIARIFRGGEELD